MNTERAAELMLDEVRDKPCCAGRSENGDTADHACWMLEGIRDGYIQHEKAHRWLGYAQGLLVSHGLLTLDRAKWINKLSAPNGDTGQDDRNIGDRDAER